jgi:lycopene beta-cyclase
MCLYDYFLDKKILVLDKEPKNTNDRTWCFWTKNNDFKKYGQHQWNQILFKTSFHEQNFSILPYTYQKIESATFYEQVKLEINKKLNVLFLQEEVCDVFENEKQCEVITTQNKYASEIVFNSILSDKSFVKNKKFPLIQQHFVGWFIETETPFFDDKVATFMDFSVAQKGNTRFMYVLPTSDKEALVEYTLFSADLLPYEEYEDAIKDYLTKKGITKYKITEKEQGNIPMSCYPFWKNNSKKIILIGTAGGWTKASTGFTFSKTNKNAKKLVKQLLQGKTLQYSYNKKSWFFDLLLIDVLFKNNQLGSIIFGNMFAKLDAKLVLKFLDEETSIWEDLKIIWSCPKIPFIKALWQRIF